MNIEIESEYTFIQKDAGVTTVKSTNSCYCPEIVEAFVYWLQGCGFHRESVIRSLQQIIETYEELEDSDAVFEALENDDESEAIDIEEL